MRYYNPSLKTWVDECWLEKEHTVRRGNILATVVVVPAGVKVDPKTGEERQLFTKAGVRVEYSQARAQHGQFVLPGHILFYQYRTGAVSETMPYRFVKDRVGQLVMESRDNPTLEKPAKVKGEPIQHHRLGGLVQQLVAEAEASYEVYRESLHS